MPAAILALDAEIKAVGPNGERWIKAEDFSLGLLMSVLEPDEIVTAVKVPVTGSDKTAYAKAAPRSMRWTPPTPKPMSPRASFASS